MDLKWTQTTNDTKYPSVAPQKAASTTTAKGDPHGLCLCHLYRRYYSSPPSTYLPPLLSNLLPLPCPLPLPASRLVCVHVCFLCPSITRQPLPSACPPARLSPSLMPTRAFFAVCLRRPSASSLSVPMLSAPCHCFAVHVSAHLPHVSSILSAALCSSFASSRPRPSHKGHHITEMTSSATEHWSCLGWQPLLSYPHCGPVYNDSSQSCLM